MIKRILVFFGILLLILPVFAGDLEESLEELTGKAAKEYVKPLSSAFGANLNSGWFNNAPKAKLLGLNAELSFVATGADMTGKKEFSVNTDFTFSEDQATEIVENSDLDPSIEQYAIEAVLDKTFDVQIYGPTVIGNKDDTIMINFDGRPVEVDVNGTMQTVNLEGKEFDLKVKALLADWEYLPMATPQLKLGTLYGTQVTLRGLPPFEYEDLGEIVYYGVGVQHNPFVWINVPMPLNIALSYYTQALEIGDVASTTATTYGITASKQFGFKLWNITPYAGLMMDESNMEIAYEIETEVDEYTTDIDEIKFSIDGENSTRLVLGSSFKSGVFKYNLELNLAKVSSASMGFGIEF